MPSTQKLPIVLNSAFGSYTYLLASPQFHNIAHNHSYQATDRYIRLIQIQIKGSYLNRTELLEAENQFIAHAKNFCQQTTISDQAYQVFLELGVSEAVLQQAGLEDQRIEKLETECIKKAGPYIKYRWYSNEDLKKFGISDSVIASLRNEFYKPNDNF